MRPGAIVLCGGRSSRMGRPKAWLPFGAETLLQRVVRLLGEVTGPIVVVAAPEQDLPALPRSVKLVRDPVEGRGPLQGLAVGLSAMPGEVDLAFATSTDAPFLNRRWIERLAERIGDWAIAMPRVGGYLHPLAAMYRPRRVVPAIDRLLQADRLRPVFLLEEVPSLVVEEEDLREVDPSLGTLRNLNTVEEYESALKDAGLEVCAERKARPKVRIELHGVPRLKAGCSMVEVEGEQVAEALAALGRAVPELVGPVIEPDGRLNRAYTLNRNGQAFVDSMDMTLIEGDTLILLHLDVGG